LSTRAPRLPKRPLAELPVTTVSMPSKWLGSRRTTAFCSNVNGHRHSNAWRRRSEPAVWHSPPAWTAAPERLSSLPAPSKRVRFRQFARHVTPQSSQADAALVDAHGRDDRAGAVGCHSWTPVEGKQAVPTAAASSASARAARPVESSDESVEVARDCFWCEAATMRRPRCRRGLRLSDKISS
jgi:hypothetical protein